MWYWWMKSSPSKRLDFFFLQSSLRWSSGVLRRVLFREGRQIKLKSWERELLRHGFDSFSSSSSSSSSVYAFFHACFLFPYPPFSFLVRFSSVSHSVGLCPLLGVPDGLGLVHLPQFCYVVGQGVVWVGGRKEGLDGQKHRANLQCGAPLVLGGERKENFFFRLEVREIRTTKKKYLSECPGRSCLVCLCWGGKSW